jgi:hypothetical protein
MLIDIDDFVVLAMLMVEGFDRDDVRSGFGLSILLFCRSQMVREFDRDKVLSSLG